jgi:hypothetical protein
MKYLSLLLIMWVTITHAEPYKVGTAIPAFSLKDQHGKTHEAGHTVRLILFCKDRRGQEIIGTALEKTSEGYLNNYNTLYVADSSGIPRLIAKFIALPKLRKQPYKVLLDPEPSVTKDFPSEKDKVTLLYMNNLTIKAIEFVDTPEEVKKAIEKSRKQNKIVHSQRSTVNRRS